MQVFRSRAMCFGAVALVALTSACRDCSDEAGMMAHDLASLLATMRRNAPKSSMSLQELRGVANKYSDWWGRKYHVALNDDETEVVVVSSGENGKLGDGDDIVASMLCK